MPRWWRCFVLLATTCVLLGATRSAGARELFVGPQGSDAGDGSSTATAFRTVQRAADAAGPGDTVRIMSGTYVESVRVFSAGAPGYPLRFTAFGDGPVVMDGEHRGCPSGARPTGDALVYAFWSRDAHDLQIDGLEIRNYCFLAVDLEGALDRIAIRDCYVHDNGTTLPDPQPGESFSGQGIYVDGYGANGGNDIVVEHNIVTANVSPNRPSGSGIAVLGSDRVTVRANVSERNNGNGILLEDCTNTVAEQNLVRFNVADRGSWGTAGIWADGGFGVTVRRNWLEGNVWAGIELTDETPSDPYAYEIYDNVAVGNWYGIYVWGIGRDGKPPSLVYQNTLVDNAKSGIWLTTMLAPGTQLKHARFSNNIVAQLTVDAPALVVDGTAWTDVLFDDNLYVRSGSTLPITWNGVARTFDEYRAASGWDAAGIAVDPLFVDPLHGDYRLAAASPAIDVGASGYSAPYDYDGRSRPLGAATDLGAFEAGEPTDDVAIDTFLAAPTVIEAGDEATLAWSVSQTTGASITPAIGAVSSAGSTSVAPTTTTTYTLVADGVNGPKSADVTVTVVPRNPRCAAVESFGAAKLQLRGGKLSASLLFDVDGPLVPPLASDQDGMRLILTERAGAQETVFADVTVPPGARGTSDACATADGWKVNGAHTVFNYRNVSGAVDAPACTAGSAQGIEQIKVKDMSARGRGVSSSIAGVAQWMPTGARDLFVTLLFDADRCVWLRFRPGDCMVAPGRAKCRR